MTEPRRPRAAARHERRESSRLYALAGALLIVVATCVAYRPAIRGELLFDDCMNLTEAIEHFREALRLRPDLPDAQYNLEVARVMQQAAIDQAGDFAPNGVLP
jgi:hypothetical protein